MQGGGASGQGKGMPSGFVLPRLWAQRLEGDAGSARMSGRICGMSTIVQLSREAKLGEVALCICTVHVSTAGGGGGAMFGGVSARRAHSARTAPSCKLAFP